MSYSYGRNSAIYAINSLSTTVTAGNIIPLTSVIRKFGNSCQLSNYGIKLNAQGYYQLNANITIAPTTAGAITVSIYKDGVQVPGAEATQVVANNGENTSMALTAIVKQTCCCEPSTYTLVTSAAGTVNNAAMTAERI